MTNKIYVHGPNTLESLRPLIDSCRVIKTVIIAPTNQDGSQICVVFALDQALRFDIESMIPGAVVYPHHNDTKPLGPKHLALLAEHGVVAGNTMRDALLMLHSKYRCHDGHPDT